jgi:hypothetical protein
VKTARASRMEDADGGCRWLRLLIETRDKSRNAKSFYKMFFYLGVDAFLFSSGAWRSFGK